MVFLDESKKIPIVIPFVPNNLGRILFDVNLRIADGSTHDAVEFKLDSGSDFTTISIIDLKRLGYIDSVLLTCPEHVLPPGEEITLADGTPVKLQYIPDLSIMFKDRELSGVRIFFSLDNDMRNLFGSDILKYFRRVVDYDEGKLILTERLKKPLLSIGETELGIYSLEHIIDNVDNPKHDVTDFSESNLF